MSHRHLLLIPLMLAARGACRSGSETNMASIGHTPRREIHMKVRSLLARLGVFLALAGGGAGALVTGPATPALGVASGAPILKVAIQSPATLIARGLAIHVRVKVRCTSSHAFLNLQVTERVGSSIASGFGFTEVACTGSSQVVITTVTDSSAKAFKKGSALAQADLFGCIDKMCSQQTASRVIQIVKPKP